MINFNEVYKQAISLFDDPKIKKAYETNQIQFAKLMYPFLNSSLSLFTNPSMIGRMLSDYVEPKGTMEIFESDGETIEFELSFVPNDECLFECLADGKRVDFLYDKDSNKIIFSEKIDSGKEYSVECYSIGYFESGLSVTNNSKIDKDIRNKTIGILARLLVLSWGEHTKNFLLDIENILTDTDFSLHPASNALTAKIKFVEQITEETYQLQNKLGHIIRFASSADWGRRYN
jgi:hypothetical protein